MKIEKMKAIVFGVLLVAAVAAVGALMVSAMGSQNDANDPASDNSELSALAGAGGTFCIEISGECGNLKLSYATIGPYTILQGDRYGCGYPCPVHGVLYPNETHYIIGLHFYPVKDSGYAGCDYRGVLDKKTLNGIVYCNNPHWGTQYVYKWWVVPCPSSSEVTTCEGCIDPAMPPK